MNNDSVFTSDFLTAVKTKLDEVCVDGAAITRKRLCEALGLDSRLEPAIGVVISLDLVPGFDMTKGRGIGVKDARPAKASTSAQNTDLTDDFKEKLRETLEDLVPLDGKTCISRKEIAKEMGSPGLKTENMISLALKSEDFPEFSARVGRYGGIFRVTVTESSSEEEQPSTVETTAEVVEAELIETEEVETKSDPNCWADLSEDSQDDVFDTILDTLSESLDDNEEELEPAVLSDALSTSEKIDKTTSLSTQYLRPDGPLARYHAGLREQCQDSNND